jgi:ribonucleotide monophosphatase NagD (HAD superfamily)
MFTYEHLDCAFRVLKGERPKIAPAPNGCPPNAPHVTEFKRIPDTSPNLEPNHLISLIATHKAKYIQSSDGALSLGPGPFVGALESATGVEAEVVGKPTRAFFETVIRSLPGQYEAPGECYDALAEEGRIAIVGDDIEADLGGGAVELGLWRVLGASLLPSSLSSPTNLGFTSRSFFFSLCSENWKVSPRRRVPAWSQTSRRERQLLRRVGT